MAPERLEARIEQLVQELEMGDFADRLCGNLSTGQKQRTSLARALLADPPVLVLDEPTAGLDIVSSEFIMRALRSAAEQGKAVLFSTHIMSEAELLCDRVVVLHEGHILADATLDELLESTGQPQLSRAFLSLIGRAPVAPPARDE
jgi:sodium transport system ATP-binding protein